jgi:hypothetical protein
MKVKDKAKDGAKDEWPGLWERRLAALGRLAEAQAELEKLDREADALLAARKPAKAQRSRKKAG